MVEKYLPTLLAEAGPAEERYINFYPSFDLPVIFISAIILLWLRHFLTNRVLLPYGRSKGLKDIKLLRFAENAWFSMYYVTQTIVGFYVLWNASWLWEMPKIYLDYPVEHQKDFDRPELFGLRFYYLVSLGFYSQALYGLLFIDEKMKDFTEMVIHHIITVTLILFSITSSFHRCGSLIILLHDFVDVFLYNAKMSHEIGREMAANILFILFTISFFILRLVCLPYITFMIWWLLDDPALVAQFPQSTFVFKTVTDAGMPFEISSYGICVLQHCMSTIYLCLGALALLCCIHVYWFTIILKLLWTTILGTGIHDPRLDNNNYNNSDKLKEDVPLSTSGVKRRKQIPIEKKVIQEEGEVALSDAASGTA
jgi:hypothetical protein